MSWKEKLGKLVSGTLSNLKGIINIDEFNLIKIVHNDSSDKKVYTDSSKNLIINTAQLNPSERKEIIASAEQEGQVLLDGEAKKRIEDFKQKDGSQDTKKILDYLRNKIPVPDIPIWRVSLYLKKCFEAGEKVGSLKSDISARYGERGRNICNLCSSNYIEDWLMPTYDLLEKNSENKDVALKKFKALYAKMVEELPFSVFVSSQDKEGEIRARIEIKMEANIKYGIKFLNIHGIGHRNIKRIYDTIKHIKKRYPNMIQSITDENHIIFVRLEFKD